MASFVQSFLQKLSYTIQAFDDATLLKLELFRGYIREWLPVFLSKKTFPEVHIYDFFAKAYWINVPYATVPQILGGTPGPSQAG